jgi:hypothetical protein
MAEECPGEDDCEFDHCEVSGCCGGEIEIGDCDICGRTHCDSCDGECGEEEDE